MQIFPQNFSIILTIATICGTIIVAILIHFVAEDYRRFRDANALAAALAGELSSYKEAVPKVHDMLEKLRSHVQAGNQLKLRSFKLPTNRIFDDWIPKLGLLDVSIIQDVVYVYHQIDAFRAAFSILISESQEMKINELNERINSCIETTSRALSRGEPLLSHLISVANRSYICGHVFSGSRYRGTD